MTAIRITILSAAMLLSGGCVLHKKAAVLPPAPFPMPPVASAPAPSIPAPEESEPVPDLATLPTEMESMRPSPFPPVAVTPAPAPVRRPPVRQAPVPPAPVAPEPTAPAPALGAILSPEERRQMDAAYLADLNQANQILGRLGGRSLTAEQQDSVSRARAWIRQAAEYHGRDLATAAELARRARVLTQDLANEVK